MIKFTSKRNDNINNILKDKEAINDLINCYGSPCNILFPEVVDKNISEFKNILKKHNISGKIFYAHKCNKSSALIKQVLINNINIDVASLEELKSALSNGFLGQDIEATGPKNDDFIILGLRHNVIFNIDNLEELEKITIFSKMISKKSKTRILIRLNDFKSDETKIINKKSRFGTSKYDMELLLKTISYNKDIIELIGLSFHLDTINIKEKVIAIENCIEIFQDLYEKGFNPYVLNIGGGFKVNYIESKKEWEDSISKLKENVITQNNSLTWNNTTFGLRQDKGTLKGNLNIYNYYEEMVGCNFLDEILSTKLMKYQNMTIGQILRDNMIELYIEPGKSLLDGAGINLAKVNYAKHTLNNDILIGLDMKKSDLLIGEQEMFVDPILINNTKITNTNSGVYFVGNLCMENDFIFKRKIFLESIPNSGDVIAFINTAGYFMDFEQSNTIKQKISTKIIAISDSHKFKFILDENYEPLRYKRGIKNEI